MTETRDERAQANAALQAAENTARANRKRKREEDDNRRTKRQNVDLQAEIVAMRERIVQLDARPASDEVNNRLATQAATIDRLAKENEQNVAEIARLNQANRELQGQLELSRARRDVAQSAVGTAGPSRSMQVPDPTPARAGLPPPEPSRGQTAQFGVQYHNVEENGARRATTGWEREAIRVRSPDRGNMGTFVRDGGLPNQSAGEYWIPPGINKVPHAALLPRDRPIERPSTPEADRPAPVYYAEKVYYHVAASGRDDARRLGLEFELKEGSDWAGIPAFARDNGLWCCASLAIDRNTLSHLTQRNTENGDFLHAGVHPTPADNVLLTHRDRVSRPGRG